MLSLPRALLLTLALAAPVRAAEVFIAPDGKDTNPGTLAEPFATFTRAQAAVKAGDTVYLRGGKYAIKADQASSTVGNAVHVFDISKSGTENALIHYIAYKDERPVFDFSAVKPGPRVHAFHVTANYVHFKGFDVVGVQVTQTGHTQSECFENHGSNNLYENLAMHDGMGIGYYALSGSNTLVLNCDAYNNWDSVSEGGRGGNADGFGCHVSKGNTGNVFRNCRAWFNSDDGYDLINCHEAVTFDHCWAMYNGLNAEGRSLGDGNGFKSGGYGSTAADRLPNPMPRNTIQFCLSVGNKVSGFYANHHTGGANWFNNSAFRNAQNFNMLERLPDNRTDIPGPNAKMRNNLGFKGGREVTNLNAEKADTASNYFTIEGLTITEKDFISLDEKQLTAPRKPDGSLPDITFMHLTDNSPLIDKGANIGFPFKGKAPDLGAFEK